MRAATIGLLLGCTARLIAQENTWAWSMGMVGPDHAADIQVAPAGNLLVVGEHGSAFSFQGAPVQWSGGADAWVMKVGVSGDLHWAVRGGGTGADRAIKVAAAPDGAVLVTGQFTGQAVLFGQSVSAAGGGTDVFVARLSGVDGSLQWLRTLGGPAFSEMSNGICVAPNGQVTVAGSFMGTASIGGQTFTSAVDPGTGAPGFDVFVASWSAAGVPLWVKHGTAPAVDQAVEVVCDATGAVYVTGQFSGTMSFGVPHVNTMQGATFLVKFDAAGQEQWFRKWGGASFNVVRDMTWSTAGDLVITGEVQGTMLLDDGTAHNIGTAEPFAYYVLRMSSAGMLMASTTVGSESPVSVAAVAQHGDSLIVLGDFNCRFTGLSAHYGEGVFMATGPKDLFMARHHMGDLGFLRAQQYGGKHAKRAGAIAFTPVGEVVVVGSFEQELFMPALGIPIGGNAESTEGSTAGAYCGDPAYGLYGGLQGGNFADAFIAKACPATRAPYDVWWRSGEGCDRSVPETPVVLMTGPYSYTPVDTVTFCIPYGGPPPFYGFIAPYASSTWNGWSPGFGLDIQWQPSVGNSWYIPRPNEPAIYTVQATMLNGCWSWSSQLVIDPLEHPTVLLSSDLPMGPLELLLPTYLDPAPIFLCGESGWLWWHDVSPPGTSMEWSFNGTPEPNDSIWLHEPVSITIELMTPEGCAGHVQLDVLPDTSIAAPNITDHVGVYHRPDGSVLTAGDTIQVCANFSGTWGGLLDIDWWIDDIQQPLPPDLPITVHSSLVPTPWAAHGMDVINWSFTLGPAGWYTVHTYVFSTGSSCDGDVLLGTFTMQFYLERIPLPTVMVPDTLIICPGDTLALQASCPDCDDWIWSAVGGILDYSDDSLQILVGLPGTYYFGGYRYADALFCPRSAHTVVLPPSPPPLFAAPSGGIVCEGDPVTLSTTMPGTDHEWTGPSGIWPVSAPSITVTTLGPYYLTMVDTAGCVVSNGPINVAAYGTPAVNVPAGGALCPGGSITVSVSAAPGAQVQWEAPLSGTGLSQVITAPGNYSLTVQACNNEYSLDFEVTMDTLSTVLNELGPILLCSGGEVQLSGPAGAAEYVWLGLAANTQQVTVTEGGSYQLVVITAGGCADTSAVVQVDILSVDVPLAAPDTSACLGGTVTVQAEGSGQLSWYADAGGTMILGQGHAWVVGPLTADTVVYVSQSADGCVAGPIPVHITMHPVPPPPSISGSATVCADGLVPLSAVGAGELFWSVYPSGADPIFNGPDLLFGPLVRDTVIYSFTVSNGCPGPTAGHAITILDRPQAPTVIGGPEVCYAEAFTLSTVGNEVVWTGPDGTVVQGAEWHGVGWPQAEGVYTVVVRMDGCWSDTTYLSLLVQHCALVVPNVFTPNGDGANDGVRWVSPSSATLEVGISNRWGQVVFSGAAMVVEWDGRTRPGGELLPEGVYFYQINGTDGQGRPFRQGGSIHLLR